MPPRISRMDLPGAGAHFLHYTPFQEREIQLYLGCHSPEAAPGGYREGVRPPGPCTCPRLVTASRTRWPPRTRDHRLTDAESCGQELLAAGVLACLNPLCPGHGILTGQPGGDRGQRAQRRIIGQEHLPGPVKHPPLAAGPAHAGLAARARGGAGRETRIPCCPAGARRTAPSPAPESVRAAAVMRRPGHGGARPGSCHGGVNVMPGLRRGGPPAGCGHRGRLGHAGMDGDDVGQPGDGEDQQDPRLWRG